MKVYGIVKRVTFYGEVVYVDGNILSKPGCGRNIARLKPVVAPVIVEAKQQVVQHRPITQEVTTVCKPSSVISGNKGFQSPQFTQSNMNQPTGEELTQRRARKHSSSSISGK